MKHLKQSTRRETQPIITWEQESFQSGVLKDLPHGEIPNTGVADVFNLLLFLTYADVRPGTILWSAVPLPTIPGRDTYVASKTGNIITKTQGVDFTNSDIDNYFIWPDGTHELIQSVTDVNTIVVKQNTPHPPTTVGSPGKVRGKINLWKWHNTANRIVMHIDTRVFISDFFITAYTEVRNRSNDSPNNVISTWDQLENSGYVFNENGVFRIDFLSNPVEMWKINTPVANNSITEVAATTDSQERRYLFTMVKLTGLGNRNRNTSNVIIKHESGSNAVDPQNEFKDFASVHHLGFIGQAGTYEEVICAATTRTVNEFNVLTAAHFQVIANGTAQNVQVDLTGTTNFSGIAAFIQAKLRLLFPTAAPQIECRFVTDHFEFNAGRNAGNTISFLRAASLVGGTPIQEDGYLRGADPFPSGNGTKVTRDVANLVGPLTKPVDEEHWTHFGLKMTIQSSTNKELFIHGEDVPIGKALSASRDVAGVITTTIGTFEAMDNGSTIQFADGTVDTIGRIISPTSAQGTAGVALAGQGAAIGGGRVMTATQTGQIVTKSAGGLFIPADVGRAIYWADGNISFVTQFISTSSVMVEDTANRVATGITIDPNTRNFNDTITDDTLQNRIKKFSLPNRGFVPLPIVNVGVISPGFMFVCVRGQATLFYSQILFGKEYLVGYHALDLQQHPIKDSISSLQDFPDQLIIYCSNSTHRTPTNISESVSTPAVGEFIAVISGVNVIDSQIGLKDFSSIVTVERGLQYLITSEPGIRKFNGYQYSENLALSPEGDGRIANDLRTFQAAVAAGYDQLLGYVFWASDDAPDV